ncbi:hypothetical protein LJK88_05875 [Paenibacillus sp. P26]|nr:hypothetical protein LJK88_05875 [Paenibacillus sp. P26]
MNVERELQAGVLAECTALERLPLQHGLIRPKYKELSRPAALLRTHILNAFAKVQPQPAYDRIG